MKCGGDFGAMRTDTVVAEGLHDDRASRWLLRRVAQLAALEDPDAVGREVLALALELGALDSAMLVRRGPSGELEPWLATGPLAVALAHTSQAAVEGLEGWLLDGAAPAVRVAQAGEPVPADLEPLRDWAQTLVAVGLMGEGDLAGALVLADRAQRTVSADEAELLELLAAHAASCLRSAELLRGLRERAARDPLTGLGHYASFHEALAASHRRPRTAVVLCDIDGFKRLNDTYGHQHGDRVLCAVAAALSNALRRGDTLYRIGGDEFAALMAVGDDREALGAAWRLHEAVARSRLGVTVSFGVAVPGRGEADGSVLARADRALYAVKDGGRDGVALAGDPPSPNGHAAPAAI